MKLSALDFTVWLMAALIVAMVPSLMAQDAPPANGSHHGLSYLTPEERQQLKTDREAVFAANPDLKTQGEALRKEGKEIFENKDSTPEEKKAFIEKSHAFEKALNEALLQQDPSIQPILEKIRQHRREAHASHQSGKTEGTPNGETSTSTPTT